MKVRSSIDGAVGEVLDLDGKGRVCVLVEGEREWWNSANAPKVPELDLAAITPEQAREVLRRLADGT